MKNVYFFFKKITLIFLLFSSSNAFSQCEIWDVTATVTACEGDFFDVLIDFEYQDVTNTFVIQGNGVNYGTFEYGDVPITLTSLDADCNTEYEFVIIDSVDDDCQDFTELGLVCCSEECDLSELSISVSECDGNFFTITIDFNYTGTTNDFFDYEIPGLTSGFAAFADLPYTIELESTNESGYQIIINENDNPECDISGEFDNPCYESGVCEIWAMTATVTECIDETFEVEIDFEYASEGFGFTLAGNGVDYGEFEYSDLPIMIMGLAANCATEYEFVATDVDNPNCTDFVDLGQVCCEGSCDLSELSIEVSECNNGVYSITIDFIYTDNDSDMFEYEIPGLTSGTGLFADLPITIELENSNSSILELLINEFDNPNCAIDGSFENPCFEDPGNCEIWDMTAVVTACEGELFDVEIDFEFANESISFSIVGNGVDYGNFQYDNLPVVLTSLVADCELEYEFIVTDVDSPNCTDFVELGTVCCEEECNLSELSIEVSECEGNAFTITIDFNYTGTTNDFFDYEIPGVTSGFAAFADLPYTIEVENTNESGYQIIINENDNPECDISGEFDNPCYDNGACEIWDATATVTVCEEDVFDVVIDFNFADVSNTFSIVGNGTNYGTFEYSDVPITLTTLDADCDLEYEFVITDTESQDCSDNVGLGTVCCEEECDLSELSIVVSECDGNFFTITIDFDYAGTTNDFFDYEIPGVTSGFAAFADLPYTIEIESTNQSVYEIFINENDNPNCAIDGLFDNPCFDTGGCEIWDVEAEVTACEGDEFDVLINFEYANVTNQFNVQGNGVTYGTFEYGDLPITIIGLDADCELEYEFVIVDAVLQDCSDFVELGVVCCEDECDLSELSIEVSECDENAFTITIDFEYTGTTNDFFDYEIPGVTSGTALFADLPLTITIENTNENGYQILINENDNPECDISGEFDNPCFDTGGCEIWDVEAEVTACEGDEFDVLINFEYANVTNQFNVQGNGVTYGTFEYGDLPITITGLDADCELEYEFVIVDVVLQDCSDFVELGVVCCEDECDLSELSIEVSECEENAFTITIDFEYTGTTNDLFDYEIPGVTSGTALFADLPLTITIENTNENGYQILINENDNPECDISGEFENPCYESGGCEIWDLEAEISACEGDLFDVVINFEYSDVSASFSIVGNGVDYGTFEYGQLPVTLTSLEADCELEYEFGVVDFENENCSAFIDVGEVCCEDDCDLSELSIEVSECEENAFTITIDFEYTGTTNDLFDYEIPGVTSGSAAFADLPLTITVENTNESGYQIIINENDNPNCVIDGEFENPCFDTGGCEIWDIEAEISACEGDLFDVVINFEYSNVSTSFSIVGNGVDYGTFEYGQLPVTLTSLEADCELEYEFGAVDSENENCSAFIDVGEVCCEDECDFSELSIVVSECMGDIFTITIDFNYTGTTNDFFDYEIPGNTSGTGAFADLPLTITIEDTNESGYQIIINENDNAECDISGEFDNPCNGNNTCEIWDVTADVLVCEDEVFDVLIDFEYANVTNQFTIQGNGVTYGTYEYGDLPITITGLDADCELEYEFVVVDAVLNDCSDFVELGTICCEDFNRIINVDVNVVIVDTIITINLDVENTTTLLCEIEVYLDEELVGTLTGGENFIEIADYLCGDESVLEFTLVNTCSGEQGTLLVDLGDIECMTSTNDFIENLKTTWNTYSNIYTISSDQTLDLKIINMSGQLIISQQIDKEASIDLHNATPGIYIVSMEAVANKARKIEKIIVIK